MPVNQFETLTEALDALKKRGFSDSFVVRQNGIHSQETGESIRPEDVTIVEHHRFEGETDPSDMSVVYAVQCADGKRGTIIDAYGTYSNSLLSDFLTKVKMREA
jgi:hypothetical protein